MIYFLQFKTIKQMLRLADKEIIDNQEIQKISKNSHENYISIIRSYKSYISPQGILDFSKGNWQYLSELTLKSPKSDQISNRLLGIIGCKNLSKVFLPSIKFLYLQTQDIDAYGVAHLSKAKWSQLTSLALVENKIAVGGLENLKRNNWKKVSRINLMQNDITGEETKRLLMSEAQNLKINVGQNPIGFEKGAVKSAFQKKRAK